MGLYFHFYMGLLPINVIITSNNIFMKYFKGLPFRFYQNIWAFLFLRFIGANSQVCQILFIVNLIG